MNERRELLDYNSIEIQLWESNKVETIFSFFFLYGYQNQNLMKYMGRFGCFHNDNPKTIFNNLTDR